MKNLISKIWPWAILLLLAGVLMFADAPEQFESQELAVLPEFSGIVSRVIDGDTFDLETGERVRLIGIDAPERGEPFYEESRDSLVDLVEGIGVVLTKDESDTDIYGRSLRYVVSGNIDVNEEMLRRGFARATPIEPDTLFAEQYFELQQEAKDFGLGLWSN